MPPTVLLSAMTCESTVSEPKSMSKVMAPSSMALEYMVTNMQLLRNIPEVSVLLPSMTFPSIIMLLQV